jgi:hypothetical protein
MNTISSCCSLPLPLLFRCCPDLFHRRRLLVILLFNSIRFCCVRYYYLNYIEFGLIYLVRSIYRKEEPPATIYDILGGTAPLPGVVARLVDTISVKAVIALFNLLQVLRIGFAADGFSMLLLILLKCCCDLQMSYVLSLLFIHVLLFLYQLVLMGFGCS